MKKITLFILIGMNISFIHSQTYKDLINKADSCYSIKNYNSSKDYFEKAFKIEHSNQTHLYNGACSAALANDTKKAFYWLNLSIDNGYIEISHLEKDSDLTILYSYKKWRKLTLKLQKKIDIIEANYDKPLQRELLLIYDEDQNIRKKFMTIYKDPSSNNQKIDSIGKIMNYKDSLNLIKIVKILDEKGWVGKDIVGPQANKTLFLVIQHSGLETQQKYFPMMREAVKKGDASPSSLALLEDRIALREGRKQIYGSQIFTNSITKKNYVSPLEDPDNVDKRRAEVGLGLLVDYVKVWGIIWNIEKYKEELPELEIMIKTKK